MSAFTLQTARSYTCSYFLTRYLLDAPTVRKNDRGPLVSRSSTLFTATAKYASRDIISSFLHKFCRSGYRRQLYLANDTQNLIPDTCFHHCWHTMGTLSIQTQPSLRDALKAAVAPIENVPEVRRNWHSTSHDTVLDLVHPSLVPVIYGQTVLQDSVVG